jgi:hypothetical protein
VQLESHATPFGGSPQQRYATLHRAIEQGLDSDDVWHELASVSAQLGHLSEAKRCLARIRDASRQAKAERTLLTTGTPRRPANQAHQGHHQQQQPGAAPRNPATAPAASDAGRNKRHGASAHADGPPGVIDHLLDAGQYLMHQHMPWLVLTTMLAFPLVVGLGGFLTAGGSPLLLAAIAALPGLTVLVIVAAMGHEILRSSSSGEGDVPNLPEFPRLVRVARDFLADAVLVFVVFFGGPLSLLIAGAPWSATLPSIALGVFFAPLTFALRQIRRDMRTFSPVFLMRAARRCGGGYVLIALAVMLAFTPAALVASAVITHAIWVQIAVVGPLCVLPTFAATRLLGTWLDTHRESLGYLMQGHEGTPTEKPAATNEAPTTPTQPRSLRRPAALEQFQAPRVATAAPRTSPKPQVRPASALTDRHRERPTPRAIEGRRPAAKHHAAPVANQPPQNGLTDVPDLGNMPGAVVVSGKERQRHGAASRRS